MLTSRQLFVAGVSPARNPDAQYQAWGHTTVVDPWGAVLATCDVDQTIVYADIGRLSALASSHLILIPPDLSKVEQIRTQIPIRAQKRNDLYELQRKDSPHLTTS